MISPRFLFAGLLCVTPLLATTTTVLVDPRRAGTDAGAAGVFATLAQARDFIRTLPATARHGTVEIRFADGIHELTSAVVFGREDSPPPPGRLVLRPATGGSAIVRGSVPVTGWKRLDHREPDLPQAAVGHVWVAPLPAAAPAKIYALFGPSGRLPRAQSGLVQIYGRPQGYNGRWDPARQFSFRHELIRSWTNFQDVELAIVPGRQFMMNRLELKSLDAAHAVVETQLPSTFHLIPYSGGVPEPCWLENSLSFLDTPGEWVSDSARRLIFFWPRDEADLSGIRAPATVELIRVEGTIRPQGDDVPVRGIEFHDLVFCETNRALWNEQTAALQHDWELYDTSNAMLRFRGAADCLVRGCSFVDGGSSGVRLDLYAQNIHVTGNRFSRLGGSGIVLAGYGPGTKDVNRGNEIDNNALDHLGEDYRVSPAIMIYQSGTNRVHHNLIHDVPYIAIALSGNWPNDWLRGDSRERSRTINHAQTDPVLQKARAKVRESGRELGDLYVQQQLLPFLHGRDNLIDHNEIFAYMLKQGDGNGIYVAGCGPGNVIRENYIHDTLSATASYAIRTDDLQCDTQVLNNLIVNVACGGLTLKHVNRFEGNIMVDLKRSDKIVHSYVIVQRGPVRGASVSRNVFVQHQPPASAEPPVWFVENRGGAAAAVLENLEMDGNLYWTPNDPEQSQQSLAAIQARGKDAHGLATDPRFCDPAVGDYRFRDDSPLRARGAVGLRADDTGPQAPWRDRVYGALHTQISPASALIVDDRPVVITAAANLPGATLRYTLDQSEPTPQSPVFRGLEFSHSAVLRVRAFAAHGSDTRGALAAIHADSPDYIWDLGDVPVGSVPPHPLKIQGDAEIVHAADEDRVIRLTAANVSRGVEPPQLAVAQRMRGRIQINFRLRVSAGARAKMEVLDEFTQRAALRAEFANDQFIPAGGRPQTLPVKAWLDGEAVIDLARGTVEVRITQAGNLVLNSPPHASPDLGLTSVNWFAWTLDPQAKGTLEIGRVNLKRLPD